MNKGNFHTFRSPSAVCDNCDMVDDMPHELLHPEFGWPVMEQLGGLRSGDDIQLLAQVNAT
jgi:hypothetical protein